MAQHNQKISEFIKLSYYIGDEIIPLAYNNKNYAISITNILKPVNERIDEIEAESGSGEAFRQLAYQVEQLSYTVDDTYTTASIAYEAAIDAKTNVDIAYVMAETAYTAAQETLSQVNAAYEAAVNAHELAGTAYTLAYDSYSLSEAAYSYASVVAQYNEKLKTYTYLNVGLLWAKTSYIEAYMMSGGSEITQEWITTTNNRLDTLEGKMSSLDAVVINPDGTVDPEVIRNNPLAYAISAYSIGTSMHYTDTVAFEDIQEL